MKTLTKEAQAALTPAKAIDILKAGNERFINNLRANRNLLQQVNETSESQHPFAAILSCIDSRASAELIFDQGLGDVFSIRVAGNVLNDDVLGSMEFACKLAGAKAVVVLGHTRCGAIKGACDGVKLGHLTMLLEKLQPAIDAETTTDSGRDSKNAAFVEKVALLNVRRVIGLILERSEILREMAALGDIALVGGIYHVTTGKIDFHEIEVPAAAV
ncbi:MAG: carbonic anhydrase family protein [Elusimicrobiota bacterium]